MSTKPATSSAGVEGEVAAQLDSPGDDAGPARPAHASLARERQVRADPLSAVEDRHVAGQWHRRAPAVENDRHVARCRVDTRFGVLDGRRRGVLDVEQLAMNAVGRHVELVEDLLGVDDHPVGPAQPPVIDVADRDVRRQQRAQLGGVEAAAQQLGFTRLAREHVDDLDSRRMTILEVGELVDEHHRVGTPIPVDHGDPAARIAEHRRGDRQRRGDSRAGDEHHVATGDGRRRA